MSNSQKRILLLDNDNEILKLIDDIMYYGYSDIYITSDEKSIYDIAKSYRPDLIILDFLLVNHNGGLICKNFKNDPDFKHIPVIIISAYRNKTINVEAYDCDAIFIKPLNTDNLTSQIELLMAS